MTLINGIDFGPMWGASGMQGVFGEGYKFHSIYRRSFPRGFSFRGFTLATKTITLYEHPGNMPRWRIADGGDGFTPLEFWPKCIIVKLLRGHVLNAVGLDNMGSQAALDFPGDPKRGIIRWQDRESPFFISFAAVSSVPELRLQEAKDFVAVMKPRLPQFRGKVELQVDFACPNLHFRHADPDGRHFHDGYSVDEIVSTLQILAELGVPLVPKFNVTTSPKDAFAVSQSQYCNALSISGAIPWGAFPDKIDWQGIFGSKLSPLAQYGGGAYSGKELLPLLVEWLKVARGVYHITKHLNAGGGILSEFDLYKLSKLADSVSVGSMAILRPWRLQHTATLARQLFPAK